MVGIGFIWWWPTGGFKWLCLLDTSEDGVDLTFEFHNDIPSQKSPESMKPNNLIVKIDELSNTQMPS